MEALILSCSTGGGHNAAGKAVAQALESRGHHVTIMVLINWQATGLPNHRKYVYQAGAESAALVWIRLFFRKHGEADPRPFSSLLDQWEND